MKNIQNVDAYKQGYIDFCRQTPPPLRTVVFSHKWVFRSFSKNTASFEKLVYNKISVI